MKLAIVGSTSFVNPQAPDLVREWIRAAITVLEPEVVISGGAEEVDTWAEIIAGNMGVPTCIFRPKNKLWEPEGYKERNILIAKECTHLLALRCVLSKTFGSGWTAKTAEKWGKKVWVKEF